MADNGERAFILEMQISRHVAVGSRERRLIPTPQFDTRHHIKKKDTYGKEKLESAVRYICGHIERVLPCHKSAAAAASAVQVKQKLCSTYLYKRNIN